MPVKPKRPCNKAGCTKLTEDRYCEEHQHLQQQNRNRQQRNYDKHRRNKQSSDFYHSKEWEAVRNAALQRDYGLCQDCMQEQRITQADVVDHIQPISLYWDLRLSLDNLRSLCHSHHNKKTAEDKRKYGGKRQWVSFHG
ncbi:HNH endonuclease [Brevibacillus formosus]|uniref:Putative HNH nuclease YajD n=1 Tax=Brevibacillus formosus TaxID=54913 RepID=A0A220MR83_9BACL|nr:HNH endonuclease signature motif containing protein [Brevibacillus formosus]ASJ57558.1 HNH endonuclease [Brevibacillus formosus]